MWPAVHVVRRWLECEVKNEMKISWLKYKFCFKFIFLIFTRNYFAQYFTILATLFPVKGLSVLSFVDLKWLVVVLQFSSSKEKCSSA